jgi:type IV secretion system protein VirD4
LPLDEVVVVVDAQMPVRAKRIQYFDDPFFKRIHEAQSGEMPVPLGPDGKQGADTSTSQRATGPIISSGRASPKTKDEVTKSRDLAQEVRKADRRRDTPATRSAVIAGALQQVEMDFEGQAEMAFTLENSITIGDLASAIDELSELENTLERGENH